MTRAVGSSPANEAPPNQALQNLEPEDETSGHGTPGVAWRAGGCHCGAVRFEAQLPRAVEAQACNCSICEKVGFIHLIVPASRFRLLQGEDGLSRYTFNTGVAHHLFCRVCGVKSFYRPRSNPDGWSVNARCLDPVDDLEISITAFDGRNWEVNAAALAHLSHAPLS